MVSVIGHEWWWQREEAGVIEKRLLDKYGAVVRWNGSLGVRSFSTICRGEILTLTYQPGRTLVGRRPQGNSPHSSGFWRSVRETVYREGNSRGSHGRQSWQA